MAISKKLNWYRVLKDKNIPPLPSKKEDQIARHSEEDWVYLIHHMHPPDTKSNVKYKMEELHHCPMFEKKNMQGKKYDQIHVKRNRMLLHVIDIKINEKFPKVLYDHLGNEFPIVVIRVDDKKYAVITKPKGKLMHDEYEKRS